MKRDELIMNCPKCGNTKFEAVGTFGYLFTGYLSMVRCLNCGYEINIEKKGTSATPNREWINDPKTGEANGVVINNEPTRTMKVYEPIVVDFDLEVSLGLFAKKEDAEKALNEAKNAKDPTSKQLWFQKYPDKTQIVERNIIGAK